MPPAVGAFVASLGAALIGGAAFANALAVAFFVAGATLVAQSLIKRPKGNAPPLDRRKQFVRLPIPARRVFYGDVKFAPSIIHIEQESDSIVILCAVAEHGYAGLRNVYINGGRFLNLGERTRLTGHEPDHWSNVVVQNEVRATPIIGTQADQSPSINSVVVDTAHDDASQTRKDLAEKASEAGLPYLMRILHKRVSWLQGGDYFPNSTEDPTKYFHNIMQRFGFSQFERVSWGESRMRARGFSWIVFQLPTHDDITKAKPWASLPQLQIEVERQQVDVLVLPGTNQNTIKGDNPARALYDYAMKYTDYGGTNFGESLIDLESFQAVAALCLSNNWTCNGVIDLETSPDVVFAEFQQCVPGGVVCDIGGKLHFLHRTTDQAGATQINASDIFGGWRVLPFLPRERRHSGVSVEFANHGDAVETASISDDRLREKFGEDKLELRSNFITNRNQALLAAKFALLYEHEAFSIECLVGAKGLSIVPNELVVVNMPNLGVNGKPFRVLQVSIEGAGKVKLNMIEEHFEIDFTEADEQNFLPALTPNYSQSSRLGISYRTPDLDDDDDNLTGQLSIRNNDRLLLTLPYIEEDPE